MTARRRSTGVGNYRRNVDAKTRRVRQLVDEKKKQTAPRSGGKLVKERINPYMRALVKLDATGLFRKHKSLETIKRNSNSRVIDIK
jgi:hypothetical protein